MYQDVHRLSLIDMVLTVRRLVDEAHQKALQLLNDNYDKMQRIAEQLMEIETLDAEQFKALLEVDDTPSGGEEASSQTPDSEEENKNFGSTSTLIGLLVPSNVTLTPLPPNPIVPDPALLLPVTTELDNSSMIVAVRSAACCERL